MIAENIKYLCSICDHMCIISIMEDTPNGNNLLKHPTRCICKEKQPRAEFKRIE